MKQFKAFTLSEVLITLTILGVIAAITVPSIIRNFQDRAQITGMKRAYALIDNAFPTSKFDATSEKEMMDEILKLKNKITVVVSNRINCLVKCSKILILNGGKIVEYGETAALVNDTKSAFSKMVKEAKTSKRIG